MAVEPTDLADRVALRLKELGISANKATSLAGLATGYVTRIRNRDRKTVSPELLEPLELGPGMSHRGLTKAV